MATVTYVAGTCKPSFKSFAHIQDALNATPAPTTVLVCPSSTPYSEQITISQSVNLQGIASADQDRPVIAPPSGGLTQTTLTNSGGTVYFQVWVSNVPGAVNISNLTVDGTGNGVAPGAGLVAGIFFQNSPGTMSRITARNQSGNGDGCGILLEGGGGNPSVSVTNSSVHDYDDIGIFSETAGAPASELVATISGNIVDTRFAAEVGIIVDQGATTTVSGNSVTGANTNGILSDPGAAGSISGNTIVGSIGNGTFGISVVSDGVPVTGNKIFKTITGIAVFSAVASAQGNNINDSTNGIDYNCNVNPNVIHNTINDATVGINDVPPLLSVPNTFFNVDTIRSQGFCQ